MKKNYKKSEIMKNIFRLQMCVVWASRANPFYCYNQYHSMKTYLYLRFFGSLEPNQSMFIGKHTLFHRIPLRNNFWEGRSRGTGLANFDIFQKS